MDAMDTQAMAGTTALVEFIMNLVFMAILGGILLIARRDMKGWDQPVKYVWFAFHGRINRKAYWLKGTVLLWIVILGAQMLAGVMAMGLGAVAGPGAAAVGALIVVLPLFVMQFWVSIALGIKRSHDLGHTGWWLLGMLIPIWNIWVGIQLLFFRGQVGPNTFGPDPIDPYEDYIDELTGGGPGSGGGEADPEQERHHPHPRAPEADDGPKGFGGRKVAPKESRDTSPPEDAAPATPIQENVDQDLIRRRLGDGYTPNRSNATDNGEA